MFAECLLVELQHGEEGLLRDLHIAHLSHPLFASLLLFEEFPFPGDISPVALGRDVLSQRTDGFSRYDLGTNSSLQSDDELLAWDEFFQFLAHLLPDLMDFPR